MYYSLGEIIDIAVGIEEAGSEDYALCAKKFADPAIGDTFAYLAREELVHRDRFRSLRGEAGASGGAYPEEYFSYLRIIGGVKIFETKKRALEDVMKDIQNPLDAVREAFDVEKTSIIYYTEMKDLYRGRTGIAALLDAIIAEERKHIMSLYELSQNLRL